MNPKMLHILRLDAHEAAPRLVGARFAFGGCSGIIVEAEAYGEADPASHSYGGRRPRNATMFKEAGRLYVYRSYGVHWCVNLVTGHEGSGQAVLLRALEPREGVEQMKIRRGFHSAFERLCAGPGNLSAAFGISGEHDGAELGNEFELSACEVRKVWAGPRIGVTQAAMVPWRFFDPGSRFLSRKALRGSARIEPR